MGRKRQSSFVSDTSLTTSGSQCFSGYESSQPVHSNNCSQNSQWSGAFKRFKFSSEGLDDRSYTDPIISNENGETDFNRGDYRNSIHCSTPIRHDRFDADSICKHFSQLDEEVFKELFSDNSENELTHGETNNGHNSINNINEHFSQLKEEDITRYNEFCDGTATENTSNESNGFSKNSYPSSGCNISENGLLKHFREFQTNISDGLESFENITSSGNSTIFNIDNPESINHFIQRKNRNITLDMTAVSSNNTNIMVEPCELFKNETQIESLHINTQEDDLEDNRLVTHLSQFQSNESGTDVFVTSSDVEGLFYKPKSDESDNSLVAHFSQFQNDKSGSTNMFVTSSDNEDLLNKSKTDGSDNSLVAHFSQFQNDKSGSTNMFVTSSNNEDLLNKSKTDGSYNSLVAHVSQFPNDKSDNTNMLVTSSDSEDLLGKPKPDGNGFITNEMEIPVILVHDENTSTNLNLDLIQINRADKNIIDGLQDITNQRRNAKEDDILSKQNMSPNGPNINEIQNNSEIFLTEDEEKIEMLKRELQVVLLWFIEQLVENRCPVFMIRNNKCWNNCIFENNLLKFKTNNQLKYTRRFYHGRGQSKFKLMVYLLTKMYSLLLTKSTCTQREIYYQLKNYVDHQAQISVLLTDISLILNIEPWYLPIVSTSKSLVFGDLTLISHEEEEIACNHQGGILVPQDIKRFNEFRSSASFVLIVEKDTVFKRLLDEGILNKLEKPFILITGKGYPDVNVRLFIKKLYTNLKIPIFILVDADPDGINIMLTYRFGSLNLAHLAEQLAVSDIRWLGILPSEIPSLNITHQFLSNRDQNKIRQMLRRPYIDPNPWLKRELEILQENDIKSEIEGIIKNKAFLTDAYLSSKIYNRDYL